jgi:DNA repair protein RadC
MKVSDLQKEDIKVTEQLIQAGEILGIEVLDHVIVGKKVFHSMKNNGDI